MNIRRLFAASSVLFLIVLAISPAKNALRPYRAIQRDFRKLGMSRARSLRAAEEYRRRPIEIRQVWLRELDDRVDRCATCHLGVADPLMDGAPEPFRLHSRTRHTPIDFDRFGCTVCHGGQGPATAAGEAHGTDRDAGPPMFPLELIEAGCGRCHGATTLDGAPMLSRGRALMAKSNCFACHAVRGQETFRPDAPSLASLPVKTGAEWLRRWLRNPKAVDPNATMPNFHLSDKEIDELSNHLFNAAVPPELSARVAAAEQEPAGNAANGKKLFSESRCISCHTVEGKGNGSAPELSKVASWATKGWLLAFLRDPHAFDPSTRMPRYRFTDAESRDVVAYFEEEFRDFDAPAGLLAPLRVNQTQAEEGQKLFRRFGCFACHAPESKPSERFGPELDGIGDKKAHSLDFGRRGDLPRSLPAWLGAKLASPRSFAQGLKMPSFDFSEEDSRAVVTALLSLGSGKIPDRYRPTTSARPALVPGGPVGALIDRYRCLSCHRIGDRGGDISTAPLAAEGSKVQRDWLIDYLMLSYSIRPILTDRMPIFRMTREEATELADAIESFWVDPSIPDDPFAGRPASDADVAEGQRLYVAFGCRSCHILGTDTGYYGPPLSNAGLRLKPGWIYSWLKGPQKWRADVRCPDYGMTDTDALRVASYLGRQRTAPTGGGR